MLPMLTVKVEAGFSVQLLKDKSIKEEINLDRLIIM